MKQTLLFLCFFSIISIQAQNKQLWAKSIINQEAPDLVVEKWLTKKPNTKGKFVLIDFWATWCAPCRRAIPDLNKFQKRFKKDLVIIGISGETKAKVRAMKQPRIEYYSAIDTQKRLNNELQVQGIPHCILIDPNGIVRWEGYPLLEGHELTEEVIATIIEKYRK